MRKEQTQKKQQKVKWIEKEGKNCSDCRNCNNLGLCLEWFRPIQDTGFVCQKFKE